MRARIPDLMRDKPLYGLKPFGWITKTGMVASGTQTGMGGGSETRRKK
jgi:hypothetical protein